MVGKRLMVLTARSKAKSKAGTAKDAKGAKNILAKS
jgi:hypothetical protein